MCPSVLADRDLAAVCSCACLCPQTVDQFGNAMGTQPIFTWALSGISTLTTSGDYIAPA